MDEEQRSRGHRIPKTDRSERRPGEPLPLSEQPREKIRKESTESSRSGSSRSSHHSRLQDEPRASTSRQEEPRASTSRQEEPRASTSRQEEPRASTSRQEPRASTSRETSAAPQPRRERFNRYEVVVTRPTNVVSKTGKMGDPIRLQANYFKLLKRPTWCIFQYHVDFSPDIELIRIRQGVLSEHKSLLGGYLFDGKQIYTTNKLKDDVTVVETKSRNGQLYKITIKFVNIVKMTEWQSLQVLNLILRKAMEGLKLQLVGRNFYDALSKVEISDWKLQLWPGYTTSIRQHEKDIMVCVEIAHKVMRKETLYDILKKCMDGPNYRENFKKQVIGVTVLTDYNNKTYRIDDVDFDLNPRKTFQMKDKEISFIDYYYMKYHLRICDPSQPLLISLAKEKQIRGGQNTNIILIPELCRSTGLTDNMRSNFGLMRSLSREMNMTPDKRIARLYQFNRRLQQTEASVQVLRNWNVELDTHLVQIPGRIIRPEKICFGDNLKLEVGSDWSSNFKQNKLFTSVELKRWSLICPNNFRHLLNDLVTSLQKASQGMKMQIQRPYNIPIYDERNSSYVNAIEASAKNDPQLIMCIVPNDNNERYSIIKKKTCVERAIPTQVITQKVLSKRQMLMSVATKVLIQMNCKLGASAWMIELPLSNLMTIGYDICKSTRDKSKAYGALVATMDMKIAAKYFSTVSACHSSDALSNDLTINVVKALQEYRTTHCKLPSRILFYRDGVGDGQLNQVYQHEVKNLVEKLKAIYKSENIDEVKFAFIVVTKKINTRLFEVNNTGGRSAPGGRVVDTEITLPERYDFYLISQSVRQGTAQPTNYNVLYDTMGLDPDRMQILTYKNTHLYYNWAGALRVPAVCQYAKKLASLVGQSLHQIPSSELEKQLYYL